MVGCIQISRTGVGLGPPTRTSYRTCNVEKTDAMSAIRSGPAVASRPSKARHVRALRASCSPHSVTSVAPLEAARARAQRTASRDGERYSSSQGRLPLWLRSLSSLHKLQLECGTHQLECGTGTAPLDIPEALPPVIIGNAPRRALPPTSPATN